MAEDDTKKEVHKKDVQVLNSRLHKIFDSYLDSVEDEPALFDPKSLALIEKYIARNGVTATEQDAEALARKQRAVMEQRKKERSRPTNNAVAYLDDIVAKKRREA